MKCIKCGKEQYLDSLCKECYSLENTAVKGFKDFSIQMCAFCGAYTYTKGWKPKKDIQIIVKEAFKKNIKLLLRPESFETNVKFPEHKQNGGVKVIGTAHIVIVSIINEKDHKEEFDVPVELKYSLCPKCCKQGTTYYEGIMQIRGDEDEINKVADFLMKEVKKASSRGVYINKEAKVKGGYDFYLTSQKYLQQVAKKLYQKFGGEFNISSKLFTRNRQTSKEVYRVNALLRLPDFKQGDILKIRNKLIKIHNIAGKHVFGMDLQTLSKTKEDYQRSGYEIKATKKDIIMVQVSKTHPHLEVLHPETYQSVKVENAIETEQDEVEVVLIDGKVWLV